MSRTHFLYLTPLAVGVALSLMAASANGAGPRGTSRLALFSKHAITTDGNAVFVGWAPDRRSLLYRDHVEPRGGSLWVASATGGGRHLVVRGPVADAMFSHDGHHILFQPAGPCCDPPIIRVDPRGHGATRVVPSGFHVLSTKVQMIETGSLRGSVAPDGRVVLYRGRRLFALYPGRRGLRPLLAARLTVPMSVVNGLPAVAISPNGRWLAAIGPPVVWPSDLWDRARCIARLCRHGKEQLA